MVRQVLKAFNPTKGHLNILLVSGLLKEQALNKWLTALAIILVLTIGGTGILYFGLNRQISDLKSQLITLRSDVTTLQSAAFRKQHDYDGRSDIGDSAGHCEN